MSDRLSQLTAVIEELDSALDDREPEAKKQLEAIRDRYRRVFVTPEGAEVLRDILRDLRFMQVPASDHQVSLQAYATVLLRKLGVIEADGGSQGAIDALLGHSQL